MKIKWVSHPFVALIRIISSIRPWRENADIRLYVPSARWNTGKVSARASGAIPVRSGKARIRTLSPIFSVLPRLSFIFLTSNVEVHLRRTLCGVRWNVLLAPIFIGCSWLRLPNHSRAVVVIPSQWAKVHCARGGHIYSGANVRGQGTRHLVAGTLDPLVGTFHFVCDFIVRRRHASSCSLH